MKMQTASTNKHISQIFFVLAAPMYWWEMVSCTNINCSVMLAATTLFGRPMTIGSAGVNGKGNNVIKRWRQNQKTKGHRSPWAETNTVPFICRPPNPLVSHWSLTLMYGLSVLPLLLWIK
jgi:hypothetical protein